MGFIKRTNKKFDYTPRYYKGEGNPYQIEHKFDEFRTTVGKNKGIKARFSTALNDLKESKGKKINTTILYIVIFLVLIFLFVIDFDISIFYAK